MKISHRNAVFLARPFEPQPSVFSATDVADDRRLRTGHDVFRPVERHSRPLRLRQSAQSAAARKIKEFPVNICSVPSTGRNKTTPAPRRFIPQSAIRNPKFGCGFAALCLCG
jgi:hypothetical protein